MNKITFLVGSTFVVGGGIYIGGSLIYNKSTIRRKTFFAGELEPSSNLENDEVMNEFFLWGKNNGAMISPIFMGETRGGYRGMFLKHDLLRKGVALYVPNECKLNAETIQSSPSVRKALQKNGHFFEMLKDFTLNDLDYANAALALTILDEKEKGKNSEFYFYIHTLPNEDDILPVLTLDYDVIKNKLKLPRTVRKEALDFRNKVDHAFDKIEKSIPYTKKQFQWAYSMVQSRCFNDATLAGAVSNMVQMSKNNDSGNPFGTSMFPLIDMANHSDAPTCKFEYNDKCIRFTALRDLKKGEEICFDYHPSFKHKELFWVFYGIGDVKRKT